MSNNPNNSNLLQSSVPKRSLTGIVTKLVGDGATYGFINDEIFFQQAKISDGGTASVGDTVYAECEYSANLPIKWNATSVKILSKANQQQAGNLNQISLEQQQQLFQQQSNNSMNIEQNQPGGAGGTPLTYQQHRQLRQNQQQQHPHDPRQQQQQQQMKDLDPMLPQSRLLPDPLANKNSPVANFNYNTGQDASSTRLLPPTSVSSGQQQTNLNPSIQPMGPANFAFTNPMGAVFLPPGAQNQFLQTPPPFLAQQAGIVPPSHLLAATQQQTTPLLPQNNNSNSNSNQNYQPQQQRQGKSNNANDRRFGDNKSNESRQTGGNRDSNRGGKNRNDNKFNDRSRSRDRDGSLTRHQPVQHQSSNSSSNNNKSKDNNSARDARKRVEGSASPRRGSSYSSSTSGQHSEKTSKTTTGNHRQQYDVQNMPKTTITENINPQNIKVRCPSSLHVPSDLKEVIVNKYYRFDLRNIPKPVNIVIDKTKPQSESVNNQQKLSTPSTTNTTDSKDEQQNTSPNDDKLITQTTNESTPPSSKTDFKLVNKYGVKVMLLSLPEMDAIYKHVFGPNLDSLSTESTAKTITSDLDNMIQLLCNKGSNNGQSLIGGKFDQNLDGFVEGATNQFEKSKRQPDLIATCKRIVMDQLNFDLSSCKKWTWLATFIYNNRNDYFSQKASIEYSYIYIPHIWTIKSEDFDKILLQNKEVINHEDKEDNSDAKMGVDKLETNNLTGDIESSKNDEPSAPAVEDQATIVAPIEEPVLPKEEPADVEKGDVVVQPSNDEPRENLNEMKVTDLKSRLDTLNVKFKSTAKKSELINLLQEHLASSAAPPPKADDIQITTDTDQVKPESLKTEPQTTNDDATIKTEEGEQEEEKTSTDSKELIDDKQQLTDVEQQTTGDNLIIQSEESQLSEGEVAASANASDTEGEMDNDRETNKRKMGSKEDKSSEHGGQTNKKARRMDGAGQRKTSASKKNKPAKVELIKEPFVVRPRDPEQQQLNLVSLHDTYQPSRYDQFELSVASTLLKESLVQHFSEYILTTLVEEYKQQRRNNIGSAGTQSITSSAGSTNSQTTTTITTTVNDTNNNASKSLPAAVSGSSIAMGDLNIQTAGSTSIILAKQEYPIPRYINLAFTYFDANHLGYLHIDDLSKLFNNTKLTISRRALLSIMGSTDEKERCQYQFIADLSNKLPPTYIYKFPKQFSNLPGSTHSNDAPTSINWDDSQTDVRSEASTTTAQCVNSNERSAGGDGVVLGNIVQYKGETYDLDKLIEQVREAEALRVNLVDRFNHAIENFDKQSEEIHVLEVSRKSLANAIKAQNEEISELKKDRDNIKKKLDNVRRGIKSSVGSLSDLLKEDK